MSQNKKPVLFDIFNSQYPSPYLNKQIQYFENVKRELKAKQTKVANLSYRKKLLEQQNKENYINELNRLRGDLSNNSNRFPIGTRERLVKRIQEIQKLNFK